MLNKCFFIKVGCAYSHKVVHSEYFIKNPDHYNDKYQTVNGIYEPNCGLDNVHMSYGHDEYLYQVTKDYLPAEALFCIRYHSFYALHRESAYMHLMNDHDHDMMKWVLLRRFKPTTKPSYLSRFIKRYLKEFNPYDLYSKSHDMPDVEQLKPYYMDLINKYFPTKIKW
jgi:inositol oxygenase